MMKNQRFGGVLAIYEKQALRALADLEGLSEAAVMRRLIRQAAREQGLWTRAPLPMIERVHLPERAGRRVEV